MKKMFMYLPLPRRFRATVAAIEILQRKSFSDVPIPCEHGLFRHQFKIGNSMRPRFYPEDLKAEAVRLVVERRQTIVSVASQLHIPSEAVRVWVQRYKCSRARTSELSRLQTKMHEMAMERNVLIKLASRMIAGNS